MLKLATAVFVGVSVLTLPLLTGCTDHSSTTPKVSRNPSPPGDDQVFNQPRPVPPVDSTSGDNGNNNNGGKNGGSKGGGIEPGAPVPEPATMLLVGTGLAGAALYRRRRNRKAAQQSQG